MSIKSNLFEMNVYKTIKINMKMLERFEEDDDVQNVYHNMEMTDDLLNSI